MDERLTMLRIGPNKHTFRCGCGCNVFRLVEDRSSKTYECNACGQWFSDSVEYGHADELDILSDTRSVFIVEFAVVGAVRVVSAHDAFEIVKAAWEHWAESMWDTGRKDVARAGRAEVPISAAMSIVILRRPH